ncbi:MAG: hypothetical protein Q9160_005962 [Pyrenula sp. 1 TL-2023]
MQGAKTTNDELKVFYNARAALEDEYARKLLALCRKPLGSGESGSLRASLDVVRGEVEATGKAHAQIAAQMKSELEEPLAAFAGGMKERRKIVQNGIEKLHKMKQQQTAHVNKSRDRYEQDTLRIKGYMAQGHMVMGQEERKNKAKLEKTQINMASNSNEYEASVKVLEDTTGRWNKEWKAACDKFQDLEEERLDFTKSSLWSFANIASTVCVSDDASCEKIRLSLENCEVEKDIMTFIREHGTGQEIPDPPRFINFCRGDTIQDGASEASEDDYSVAQFQRTINPAFRTSSPNPSTYESHHDPQSELAQRMGHGLPNDATNIPPSREATMTPPRLNDGQPAPLDFRRSNSSQPSQHALPPGYQASTHGDIAKIPHNDYPADGMTMFCRTGPPSTTGSGLTRPSSRDSASEYSNPTSFSSIDPVSGKSSPTKQQPLVNGVEMPGMSHAGPSSPDKSLQKKRSGFFSNSPFRRKSKHEKDFHATPTSSNRNTWAPRPATSASSSPTKRPPLFSRPTNNNADPDPSSEPVDPRASFQLNVGNNVFDVASPDSTPRGANGKRTLAQAAAPTDDPIARALQDLKGVPGKQSSVRVSADRYHGIATPGPEKMQQQQQQQSREMPPAYNGAGGGRGGGAGGLGVPQPAFTAKEMNKRMSEYTSGAPGGAGGYGRPGASTSQSRPGTRDGRVSPGPGQGMVRARSPQPARAVSPNPYGSGGGGGSRPRGQSVSPQKAASGAGSWGQNSRHNSPGGGSMEMQLAQNQIDGYDHARAQGGGSGRSRPRSAFGGEAYGHQQGGGAAAMRGGSGGYPPSAMDNRGGGGGGGGMGDNGSAGRRERSKSMVAPPNNGNGPAPGMQQKQALHFARALYSYTAAIPEELSFGKNDRLAVLRCQDDGWWEAEVRESARGGRVGGVGLVPSNYLVRC